MEKPPVPNFDHLAWCKCEDCVKDEQLRSQPCGHLGYGLNPVEDHRLSAWIAHHTPCKKKPKSTGAAGVGSVELIFGTTGIGSYVYARCTFCKVECNITDYGNW